MYQVELTDEMMYHRYWALPIADNRNNREEKRMAEKKVAPAKKVPVRKVASKKTAAAKGDSYACEVCGLVVSVDEVCGCVETCDILCCGEPMKKSARAKAAKK